MSLNFILVFLCFSLSHVVFAMPAQLIEPGTKIHLSNEIKKALSTSGQQVFVQDKQLKSENEINKYREYCEVRGAADVNSRVVDSISYIVGKLVNWTTNLELRSDDPVVFNPFILNCQTSMKFELSTEEIVGILGDLITIEYNFGDDAGAIRNFSRNPSMVMTLSEHLELPNVTYSQPPIVLKDGKVIKTDVPNSIRLSNQSSYPKYYRANTKFLVHSERPYIVMSKKNSPEGIKRQIYSIVNVTPINDKNADPFRMYLLSDRNSELSLEDVKRNLSPVFKF